MTKFSTTVRSTRSTVEASEIADVIEEAVEMFLGDEIPFSVDSPVFDAEIVEEHEVPPVSEIVVRRVPLDRRSSVGTDRSPRPARRYAEAASGPLQPGTVISFLA